MTQTTLTIQPEKSDDFQRVNEIIVDAFSGTTFGYNDEVQLADRLRTEAETVSWVACTGEAIVGHAIFSPVTIYPSQRKVHNGILGMGLGPLSVEPDLQRQGIGSVLVNHGLAALKKGRYRFVVVLGDPEFYGRFGFEVASDHGISHGFDGIPQKFFQVHWLGKKPVTIKDGGQAFYAPAFGWQHDGDSN